jgi:hypothetical protein
MFLVSMADIIGSYDAVRAVAVAKRREYFAKAFLHHFPSPFFKAGH